VGLPDGEEIMKANFLRFDTIPARARQTDGHIAIANTAVA